MVSISICFSMVLTNPANAWCLLKTKGTGPYENILQTIIQNIQKNTRSSVQVIDIEKNRWYQKCMSSKSHTKQPVLVLGEASFINLKRFLSENPQHTMHQDSFFTIATSKPDHPKVNYWVNYIPKPGLLFEEVKKVNPSLTEIHMVIYKNGAGQFHWFIQQIQKDASEHGITPIFHEIQETKEALNTFTDILDTINGNISGLWLSPYHGQYGVDSLLPILLRQSIRKKIPVISNNLSFVNKGLLLGIFPDNALFGQQIAGIMNRIEKNNYPKEQNLQVFFMEQGKTAINKRTAQLLNKPLSRKQRKSYDLVFPKK